MELHRPDRESIDLTELRTRSLAGNKAVAIAMVGEDELPITSAWVARIGELFAGDLVVELNLADMMADRVGIARGLNRALLTHHEGPGLLRSLIPPRTPASNWLLEQSDLSEDGAEATAHALSLGDYDCAATLSARTFRPSLSHIDTPRARGQVPINESDARVLVQMMIRAAGRVVWVLLEGLEECLVSSSPKCRGSQSALVSFMRLLLGNQSAPCVLLSTCWRGAKGSLRRLDPAIVNAAVDIEPDPWQGGVTAEAQEMIFQLQRLIPIRLEPTRFGSAWLGLAENRLASLALLWPDSESDPGAHVARVAHDVAQTVVGDLVVCYPRWAHGQSREVHFTSLELSQYNVALEPLRHVDAACLVHREESAAAQRTVNLLRRQLHLISDEVAP